MLRHRRTVIPSLVLALAGTVATMMTPAVLQRGIDQALVARSAPLGRFTWALTALVVVAWATGTLSRRLLLRSSAHIEFDLRDTLHRHLGRQSFAFHDRAETGQLISRANSDLRVIQLFLVFGPAAIVLYLGALVALVVMLRTHVGLTVVALAAMPAVTWLGIRMRRVMFPLSWLVQARKGDLTAIVEENLSGAHVVRAMAAELAQIRRLDVSAQAIRWASVREVDVRARYEPLMAAIPQVGTALFLLAAGWFATRGTVTIGTIVLFTGYVSLLQFPLRTLGFLVMMAQRARAASGRMFELLDSVPAVRDAPAARPLVAVRGDVRLEDVTFAYDDGRVVLHGVSLDVRAGETVALVGPTAAGKSTLLHLIPRFYDVTGGAVRVDGQDVRDLVQESLRRHVGIAMQDAFLFTATIRENIAYGRPDATFDEVRAAADVADATRFIERLPDGWETVVGERGYTLSGGQRQRVAIARVLLQAPTIVLLDDATSAVDVEVEHRIVQRLRHELSGRTTIIVSHRPATIALADRVIVLERGRIVASGSHDDLLAHEPRYGRILAMAQRTSHRVTPPREGTPVLPVEPAVDLPGLLP